MCFDLVQIYHVPVLVAFCSKLAFFEFTAQIMNLDTFSNGSTVPQLNFLVKYKQVTQHRLHHFAGYGTLVANAADVNVI
jgi:hypothetical protein